MILARLIGGPLGEETTARQDFPSEIVVDESPDPALAMTVPTGTRGDDPLPPLVRHRFVLRFEGGLPVKTADGCHVYDYRGTR